MNTVKTTERQQVELSLWNYYRGEPNNTDSITNSASFKYKSNVIGKIPHNDNDVNNTKDVEIAVP